MMKKKFLFFGVTSLYLMFSQFAFSATACQENNATCPSPYQEVGTVSNEELIKISDDEYIYKFTFEGKTVESISKKKGDIVSSELFVDEEFFYTYEYNVNAETVSPLSKKPLNEFSESSLGMLAASQYSFDGLNHTNPYNSSYGHPDKAEYGLDIFSTQPVIGSNYIHLQIGRTASGILINAPTWMLGSMIGSGAGVVVGSLIGGPPGAMTAAIGGGVVGAAVGSLIAVVASEIISADLRDEDGNIWLVIDPAGYNSLAIEEEDDFWGTTYYLRGGKTFRYISLGKHNKRNFEVSIDLPIPTPPN